MNNINSTPPKVLLVEVHNNGMIRNSKGQFIGKLAKEVPFESEHLTEADARIAELEESLANERILSEHTAAEFARYRLASDGSNTAYCMECARKTGLLK
jgi:hypothetical protein